MKQLSRVVWQEGMYLSPHHFQAQGRYFEQSIGFVASAIAPLGVGFAVCIFDQKAVRTGTLRLLQARGFFPDGMPFDMPDQDELPPEVAMADVWVASEQSQTIYLGLPASRPGGNFGDAANATTRFRSVPLRLNDEALGRGEAEIDVGVKNVRLLTAPQTLEKEGANGKHWTHLPAVRVIKDSRGLFGFDETFIPAAMRVSASPSLVALVERITNAFQERADSIVDELTERDRRWGINTRSVGQFWFLHTVNTSLAKLQHLINSNCHPTDLFAELSHVAGALCTFVNGSSSDSLPAYDSLNPGPSFEMIHDFILRNLDVAFPIDQWRISFEPVSDGFWECKLSDARMMAKVNAWVLRIRSAAAESVASRAPRIVKVCSSVFIRKLVERQHAGFPIQHLPVAPAGCSDAPENQYFSIERAGPCWESVHQTNSVGVYAPRELNVTALELIVYPEN